MNVHLPVHLDRAEFLAWVQGREEHYELAQGRVVMMTGASLTHARIVRRLMIMLDRQLDPHLWEAVMDFGLDLGPKTLRYPDIMVVGLDSDTDDHMTREPVLIAEVLSPSTAELDLGDKAAEYLRVPSLLAYLVFTQETPKAFVWMRGTDGFTPGPQVVVGSDKSLKLESLNVDLPFGEIYAGIGSN
jgi:Uma2 family endonuclease